MTSAKTLPQIVVVFCLAAVLGFCGYLGWVWYDLEHPKGYCELIGDLRIAESDPVMGQRYPLLEPIPMLFDRDRDSLRLSEVRRRYFDPEWELSPFFGTSSGGEYRSLDTVRMYLSSEATQANRHSLKYLLGHEQCGLQFVVGELIDGETGETGYSHYYLDITGRIFREQWYK